MSTHHVVPFHQMPSRRLVRRRRRVALVACGAVLAALCALTRRPSPDGDPLPASLGPSDGLVATGASISPFSDAPAIARLRPGLRAAIRAAARDARSLGVQLRVDSGWRSRRYQAALLRRARRTYGSEAVAREYVLPPSRSQHVRGAAVDVGPPQAARWLAQTGVRYGLCQIYANEAWHFELATRPGGTCPALRADAAAGKL